MSANNEIRFENLRQRTATVGSGVLERVSAVKPFESPNAHGVLRKVEDYKEVATVASAAAKSLMELIKSKE